MALTGNTNEEKIWNYLYAKLGNAYGVAGIMGNMYAESGLRPNNLQNSYEKKLGYTDSSYTSAVDKKIYTNFVYDKDGYGLVQWTPYTKYSDWAGEGWEDNGQKEMERIIYELENGLQWGATSKYPMSFRDFTTSDKAPSYLAQVWLYNYERPASLNQPLRSTQADYWYQYITGHEPPKSIPIWLLIKMSKGGRS